MRHSLNQREQIGGQVYASVSNAASGGDKPGVIVGYYCNKFKAYLHLLKWKVAHLFAFVNLSFAVLAMFFSLL